MATLNKVLLIGNLTRDPELRVTPKGTSICQFGLAVNRQFKDESGAMREETTFLDIEAWGKQGELVAKYLTKGSPCFVEGRLRLDQWEDKESKQKRSRIKIVLENVQFLGRAGGGNAPAAGGSSYEGEGAPEPRFTPPPARSSAPPARQNPPPPENIDEDVPF